MKIKKPAFLVEAEQKIKKIVDLLRDKKVVRFTLSVQVYRDDVREPKTISMQGKRAADGDWDTEFLQDRHSGALQSPEILKEKLASIEKAVRGYVSEYALDAGWTELDVSLRAALASGLAADSLENQTDIPISAIAGYSYEAHFCAPIMATAYAIQGTQALAKNDLDRASHCVDRGRYWSSPDILISNPKDRFTERAAEGGKGRALRHEPVKNMAAELMMTLRPDGWESTWEAIDTVTNELIMKHHSFVEACSLKTENLSRVIQGWVRADPGRFPHHIKSNP